MFDFFKDRKVNGCFKVLAGDFVTDDSGTGIVHCAPGFG
jgi:isoleucyl-tRNA synthetase